MLYYCARYEYKTSIILLALNYYCCIEWSLNNSNDEWRPTIKELILSQLNAYAYDFT